MSDPVPVTALSVHELAKTVAEARRLLARDLSAAQFLRELLQLLRGTDEAAVAAVWMLSESRSLGLYEDAGLTATGLLNDAQATHSHQQLLIEGCLSAVPLIRPHTFGAFGGGEDVLLIPIQRGGKPIGVIELFGSAPSDSSQQEEVIAALADIADCVEHFLVRLEERERGTDPPRQLDEFRSFAAELHRSLELRRVQNVAATELLRLCNCDRVTVLDVNSRRCRVRAVSGHSQTHRHSRQMKRLEEIVAEVCRTGKRFQFPHGDARLPDWLIRLLSDHLDDASAQMVLVEPVFDTLPGADDERSRRRPRKKSRPVAAIVFEQFNDSLPNPQLLRNLDLCGRQVGLALSNARRHSRLASIPGLSIAGCCWQGLSRSGIGRLGLALVLLLLGGWSLLALETDLQIDCRGRLLPVDRQHVFAPVDGEVAQVFVVESQEVQAGDPLFQLRSADLEVRMLDVTSRIRQSLKERDAIRAELRSALAAQSREQSARLQAEHEVVASEIAALEAQRQLLSEQEQQLMVTAPISGTVTTPRPQDHLSRKPVQRGERLLELMSVDGPWQLELELPEKRAGHLLKLDPGAPIPVTFRLAAYPEHLWQGQVATISDRTMLSEQHGTAIRIHCEINARELPHRRIGMDASAQVNCGSRSLMFVYFGELQEYLQRHWWL